MTITLSKRRFSGPYSIGSGRACKGPGIYAFLSPRNEILYIGQSGQVSYRVGPGHHKWRPILRYTRQPKVAFLCMDGESEQNRRSLERILIKIHQPPCNG